MEILTIGRSLLDLFFPKRCLNCDTVISLDNPLCVICASKLPYTHWQFNQENLSFEKLSPLCPIVSAYSLLYFQKSNVTQSLLHHLKYHQHQEIGVLLAEKVLSILDLSSYDGVIPVPIHPKKLKKRGYNQVHSFAKTLADRSGILLIEDYLIRVQNNTSQVFKGRKQRLNSIQNAFSLRHEKIAGHWILVDDVLTTGATLSTCVNLLAKKNDAKISVLTMACGV